MVVFFDLDGTIVDDSTQIIPDSAIRAVEELGRRGHLAVVNTGRPYGHIDPRIRRMAFSGWICGCGMEVLLDEKWLHRAAPAPEVCQFTVDAVRDCGMQVLYEDTDRMYRDGSHSDAPRPLRQAQRLRDRGVPVEEIDSLPAPKFIKFITHDAPGCRRAEFLERTSSFFIPIDRGRGMIEYVLKGCSKAEGMNILLRHLGLGKEDALAIGDSTNDLPMFEAAGHTVCMGSGMAELKEKADYITSGVLEDGIEKALQHYGLI